MGNSPLYSQFADDPEMMALVHAFVANFGNSCIELTNAVAQQRHDEVKRIAHQIKGAGGGYGYQDITIVASALEVAAEAGVVEDIARHAEELNYLHQRALLGLA